MVTFFVRFDIAAVTVNKSTEGVWGSEDEIAGWSRLRASAVGAVPSANLGNLIKI